MKKRTKNIFIASIILLVYGYLCRLLNIYFFWDSKSFGWLILFFGIIFFLFDLSFYKKRKGQKTTWVSLLIGILLFGLITSIFITFNFYTAKPYQDAIKLLKINSIIKNKIGIIKSFGLFPTGSIIELNNGESGNAVFYMTLKGSEKFKDVKVTLEKKPNSDWRITSIQ